jgi:hypothetical protein
MDQYCGTVSTTKQQYCEITDDRNTETASYHSKIISKRGCIPAVTPN